MNMRNRLVCLGITAILFLFSTSSWVDCNLYLPLIAKSPPSTPPTLHSVFITPNSAPSGSIVDIIFEFQFSDPNGDLGGGSLNFIDPGGNTNSLPIPGSYQGYTSGTGYGYLNNMENELPPGKYDIPVYLKDKAGNQSNILFVVWTVT
jgi:hypothetical protein